MKIDINPGFFSSWCRGITWVLAVCLCILMLGHNIGTDIEPMDSVTLTWGYMVCLIGMMCFFFDRLARDLKKIAEKEKMKGAEHEDKD